MSCYVMMGVDRRHRKFRTEHNRSIITRTLENISHRSQHQKQNFGFLPIVIISFYVFFNTTFSKCLGFWDSAFKIRELDATNICFDLFRKTVTKSQFIAYQGKHFLIIRLT